VPGGSGGGGGGFGKVMVEDQVILHQLVLLKVIMEELR
jgi:hypothetical protein